MDEDWDCNPSPISSPEQASSPKMSNPFTPFSKGRPVIERPRQKRRRIGATLGPEDDVIEMVESPPKKRARFASSFEPIDRIEVQVNGRSISDTLRDLKSTKDQLVRKDASVKDLHRIIKEKDEKISEVTEDRDVAKAQLGLRDTEATSLHQIIKNKDHKISVLIEELEEAQENNLEGARERIAELNCRIIDKKSEISGLSKDLREAKEREEKSRGELHKERHEKDEAVRELTKIRAVLGALAGGEDLKDAATEAGKAGAIEIGE